MSAATSIQTPFHYDAPLFKADEARQLIWARAAAEEPDKSGEILDYASAVPEFKKWSAGYHAVTKGRSLGNIRAMHNHRHIAGKVESIAYDDAGRAIDVCVKVLDPVDWAKVQSGGYTGLSIGGGYLKKWADPDNAKLTRYTPKIMEISLVDSPCIPSARILEMTKRDGTVNEIPLTGQPRTFGQMREPRTFGEMSKVHPVRAAFAGAMLGSAAAVPLNMRRSGKYESIADTTSRMGRNTAIASGAGAGAGYLLARGLNHLRRFEEAGDLAKIRIPHPAIVGGLGGALAGVSATPERRKGETAAQMGTRMRNHALAGGAVGVAAGFGAQHYLRAHLPGGTHDRPPPRAPKGRFERDGSERPGYQTEMADYHAAMRQHRANAAKPKYGRRLTPKDVADFRAMGLARKPRGHVPLKTNVPALIPGQGVRNMRRGIGDILGAKRARIMFALRALRRSEETGDLNKAYTDTWSATGMGTGDTRLGGTEARSLGGYTTGPYQGAPVARWLHSDGSVVEGDDGVLKRVKLKIGREGHVVPVVADDDGIIVKRAPDMVGEGSPRRAAMALALRKATRLGKGNDIAFTTALASHIEMSAIQEPALEKFSGRALALGGGGALAGGVVGGLLAHRIGLPAGAGVLVGSVIGGGKGIETHNALAERDKKVAVARYYRDKVMSRGLLSAKQHEQRVNAAKRRWKKEGQSELPNPSPRPHGGILGRGVDIPRHIAEQNQLHDVHDAMDAYDKVRPHVPADAKVMIGIHEGLRPDRHLLYNPEDAGLDDFDDHGHPTGDIYMLHPHEVDDFIARHGKGKVKKSDAIPLGLVEHVSQIPGA